MEHSLTDGSVLVTAEETGGDAGEWVDVDSLALGCENIGGMVVQSAHMRRVLKTIARLGPYKATVLVHGESGTGKELVARALHTL
ncbi:MAG TPA: sigma 54-interacting transcriptional regulator, partial [Candidatus Binataceae bacterium]|nr:sigma 54-interacting transcriptional regulator [Candidatus Binataceae bacterium]